MMPKYNPASRNMQNPKRRSAKINTEPPSRLFSTIMITAPMINKAGKTKSPIITHFTKLMPKMTRSLLFDATAIEVSDGELQEETMGARVSNCSTYSCCRLSSGSASLRVSRSARRNFANTRAASLAEALVDME